MLRPWSYACALVIGLLPILAQATPSLPLAPSGEPLSSAVSREERIGRLRQQVAEILRAPVLRRVRVGLSVLEASDGEEVLNYNADSPFNPASNTKIVTTAAALTTLGPDFRYRTVLLTAAPTPSGAASPVGVDGVLHGDLFLQGSSDPSLTAEGLADLASDLHRAGVERIEGEVRIDGQLRDLEELTTQAAPKAYGGGSLILNGDRYTVHVSPGSIGHPAAVWVSPRQPFFVVHGQVRTVRGKRSRVLVDHSRRDGVLVVSVRGRIGDKSRPVKLRQRLGDSSGWAAATLAQALADFGITVTGGVHLGLPPAGPLTIVAEHHSEPLSKICHIINKDSNNFVADSLFKTMGAVRFGLPGTLEKGARALSELLPPLGLKPERLHLVNGSGLTHENRLRPLDLGQLLYRLYHSLELGPEFLQSLAIGGIDGTIHHRFRGPMVGLVRGKTGTLSGVSVLSGYVGAQPGVMIFCIFVEGFRGRGLAAIRQAQARIVEALMRFVREGHPAGEPTRELSPDSDQPVPPIPEPLTDSEDDEA